ncbi:MAG: type II toxin-antitoxin system VapC family toxin [Acidobacteriota bacterium]|nr:type II toxin-antitoxin system VapC family toxin [Acidobacteriota bacterium]MDH3523506.1 type II toxin-antitoxin system VapC family toxin [Acidobacteriota bacterium]
MAAALYLDSSAILRPVLERGLSPEIGTRIEKAEVLVTSRLSLVETARAFHRVRLLGRHPEALIADGERAVRGLWRHCEIWELDKEVCELAEAVSPTAPLRGLDALHLATFILARREIAGLRLLTADDRLHAAAGSA